MKKFIAATALSLCLASAAFADEDTSVYPDLASIPKPLLQQLNMYNGGYEEMYVSSVLGTLRNAAADKMSLTKDDVERLQARQKRYSGQNNVNEILRYDLDFDERVTADEIRQAMKDQRREYQADNLAANQLEDGVKSLMKRFDTDGDGVITFAEAQSVIDAQNKRAARHLRHRNQGDIESLLALDPNHDGTLTAAELESLARKAFRTVDADHDGIISAPETLALQKAQRPEAGFPEGCEAPAPAGADKVVFVSLGQTGAVSDTAFVPTDPNAGVRAERMATGAAQLDVAPGKDKLYIIAQSALPVIWNVTGDTQRVSRLVLAGPGTMGDDPKVQAGAAGLDAANVSFLKGDENAYCMLQNSFAAGDADDGAEAVKTAIKKLLSKPVDSVVAAAYGSRVTIAADSTADLAEPAPSDDAAGLDPGTWKEARLMLPGGLLRVKGKTIVADTATELYPVLPGWAGLAQLVHDGVLVAEPRPDHATRIIVSGEGGPPDAFVGPNNSVVNETKRVVNIIDEKQYRVVKPLTDFPPGLGGDRSLKFVLAKGVPKPDKPLPVCLMSEETGKPVGENTWLCGGRGNRMLIRAGGVY